MARESLIDVIQHIKFLEDLKCILVFGAHYGLKTSNILKI
jgi:predicted RNA-binding protein with PIN domain